MIKFWHRNTAAFFRSSVKHGFNGSFSYSRRVSKDIPQATQAHDTEGIVVSPKQAQRTREKRQGKFTYFIFLKTIHNCAMRNTFVALHAVITDSINCFIERSKSTARR